jgi:hypothetical protein
MAAGPRSCLVAPRWGGLVRRPAAGAGAARQQWALQAGPAVEALALGEHLAAIDLHLAISNGCRTAGGLNVEII